MQSFVMHVTISCSFPCLYSFRAYFLLKICNRHREKSALECAEFIEEYAQYLRNYDQDAADLTSDSDSD